MIQTERHIAVAADSNDPDKRGRIKIRSLSLLGSDDVVLHDWIEPCFDWGWFYVPDQGEQVEIEVVSGSDKDEVPGQAFLESPDYRWRGKRFYSTSQEVPSGFTTNYGKRRGFATPGGHILIFDDTSGQETITLTWKNALGQTQQIEIVGGEIKLGVNAVDFVALAAAVLSELQSVKTDLDNVKSTFDSHTHVLAIAGASGTGATGTAAVPDPGMPTPHTPGSVAATKVKAE